MSKITFFLFIVFLIFLGLLLFVLSNNNENTIINSFTIPLSTQSSTPELSLSLSTNSQSAQAGQTIIVAVLIHNSDPNTGLVQLELSYDPQIITVDSLAPGTFFTNPVIALQNVDPNTGRISYALRCPTNTSNINTDCADTTVSTAAVITLTINPYALKKNTTLSFLPKTIVRTHSGKDLLQQTNNLQLTIEKPLFPVATSSAITPPGAIKMNH